MPNWTKMRRHFDMIRSSLGERKSSRFSLVKRVQGGLEEEEEDPVSTALSSAASLFVGPNVTYMFRLAYPVSWAATSGSTSGVAWPWDPSSVTEYSTYLIFLFNEVRIRHARISLKGSTGTTGAAMYNPIISSDLGLQNSPPSAASFVADNPNSMIMSCLNNCSQTFHLAVDIPNRLYAPVGAPVNTPDAGCYGQFQACLSQSANASETVMVGMVELFLEFRSRT